MVSQWTICHGHNQCERQKIEKQQHTHTFVSWSETTETGIILFFSCFFFFSFVCFSNYSKCKRTQNFHFVCKLFDLFCFLQKKNKKKNKTYLKKSTYTDTKFTNDFVFYNFFFLSFLVHTQFLGNFVCFHLHYVFFDNLFVQKKKKNFFLSYSLLLYFFKNFFWFLILHYKSKFIRLKKI